MHDLVIRGALVVDGSGMPARLAEVAIDAGRIRAVGRPSRRAARRTIDADGAVLAPGFIDLHSHADFTLPRWPRASASVRQGVTTLVVGNCGFSPFPVVAEHRTELEADTAFLRGGLELEPTDAGAYAESLRRLPLAVNVALFVGHGAVRLATMGAERRSPSETELRRMEALVTDAMVTGAFGLSSGLAYAPGAYAETDELVTLARVVGRHGGLYASHLRNESDGLADALDEALAVGYRADVRVQVSHLKALGRRNRGRVGEALAAIEAARAAGVDVAADAYPYAASSTGLASLLPAWALEGGAAEAAKLLADPAGRARVRAALLDHRGAPRPWEPETVVLSALPAGSWRRWEGRSLIELAATRGEDAVDSVLAILAQHPAGVEIVRHGIADEDVATVLEHPLVAVASDGWTLDPGAGGRPHPRSYGTFARVLGRVVREERRVSLEEAVRKMTALPAARVGLADRGLVREGLVADLVLFDPARIVDRATYVDPHRFAEGVLHVLVGGRPSLDSGAETGEPVGSVLRRWGGSG